MEYLLHGVRDKILLLYSNRREDRGIKAQVRLADRDRQTETGRHRDWQTQRPADTETGRHRDWQTQRLADRDRDGADRVTAGKEMGRQTDRWTEPADIGMGSRGTNRHTTRRQADRETDRQGARQAGRLADRKPGRQGEREAGRQGDRQAGREGARQTGREGARQTGREGARQTGRQADRERGSQADRERGRQADRETGRQNTAVTYAETKTRMIRMATAKMETRPSSTAMPMVEPEMPWDLEDSEAGGRGEREV